AAGVGLGRAVGRAVATVLTEFARALLVPEHIQLVPRRDLRRQPQVRVVPCSITERLPAVIGIVGPGIRVAGVLVVVDVRDVLRVALSSGAQEEPEPVLAEGTTDRSTVIVVLDERCGCRQPGVLQLLTVIAALERLGTDSGEEAARVLVAAGARHDVEQ